MPSPDPDLLRPPDEVGDEVVGDGLLDDQPGARRADLAGVQEHAGEHVVDRAVPRIVALMSANTMCGFLPPSSTATLVTCSAATFAMVRAGGQPAGERDEVDVGGVGQRRPERRAAALHQIHHRGRHARLFEQVDERDRRSAV